MTINSPHASIPEHFRDLRADARLLGSTAAGRNNWRSMQRFNGTLRTRSTTVNAPPWYPDWRKGIRPFRRVPFSFGNNWNSRHPLTRLRVLRFSPWARVPLGAGLLGHRFLTAVPPF